mgnify:CR=1 FL=1
MWGWLLIAAGIYALTKKKSTQSSGEAHGAPLSGLGVGGQPRLGRPKTDEERRKTHRQKYGTDEIPPRGTGVGGKKGEGLGVGGGPRLGQPKTDEERKQSHVRIFGNVKLPERGTGLKNGCCD